MSDIKYIIDKLDKMDDRLNSMDVTLKGQHVSLTHHIKRSDANEENIEIVKNESNIRLAKLESHKDMVMGAIAILGVIGTIILGLNELGFNPFK